MLIGLWETYNDALFIDRPRIFARILKWIRQPHPKRRVLCLVAPPGFGKTWMLNKIKDELSGLPNRHIDPPPLVLWLQAHKLMTPDGEGAENAFNRLVTDAWVESFYNQARTRCLDLPAYRADGDFPAALENLVNTLAPRPEFINGVLVLVDGYDEIPESQRDWLSERILSRFINNNFHKFQLIIPLRDPTGLYQYDLNMQQQIEPLLKEEDPLIDPYRQLTRYCEMNHIGLPSPEVFHAWQEALPFYTWENPYVNIFFASTCINNPAELRPITADDVRNCVKSVLERPDPNRINHAHYPPVTPAHLHRLYDLANCLDPEFTADDLDVNLHISFTDDLIKQFIEVYSVLGQVRNTQRYTLVRFLRDLLNALEVL
jgi:hypothetical protein